MSHFAAVKALVDERRARLEEGLGRGGARATDVARAMLAYFAGEGTKQPDPDVAAATLVLLSYSSLPSFAIVPEWWLDFGGAFALDALCRTLDFGRNGSFRPDMVWLFEAKDAAAHLRPWEVSRRADEWFSAARDGLRVLRGACDDDGSIALAERARANAPLGLRCALSFIVTQRPQWAKEDALACAAAKPGEPYYVRYMGLLFSSLADADAAEALAQVAPTDSSEQDLQALADRIGDGAVRALATMLARGGVAALAPLCSIQTENAAVALLPSLAIKAYTKTALAYYTQHHELAIRALVPVARDANSKLAAAARSALGAVSAAHPEASVDIFGERVEVASATEVPPILAAPPWLAKRATKKSKTEDADVAVTPVRVPLRADWLPGERDEWDAYGSDNHVTYHRQKNPSPDWEAKAREDEAFKAGWGVRSIDFMLMHTAPEEIALRAWTEARDERRLYYPNKWYGSSILAAVARRGPKFVPGLLALVKLRPSGADRMPIDEIGRVLVGFDGSEIAETLLDAFGSGKKLDAAALAWAERRMETMCLAAVPRALTKDKAAIALLRALVARGHADAIGGVADRYGVREAVETIVGTDPLQLFPPKLPKLPSFVRPDALPQVLLSSGRALPAEATRNLCTMLAFSTLDAPYAGIAQVRASCTHASLRDFALGLFDAWLAESAPPKEAWAMTALGHFGDDEVVRRLVPLVRAWPGDGLSARAVAGLGVLEAIGTDLALCSIDGIAQKTKFQSIKLAAAERIAKIASRRGLSPEDLSDRLVPDLGLDARGGLDLGEWRVVLDEQLEARLLDASGKAIKNLPKSAKEPAARLKALKKDLKSVAAQRVARLETLMITRRTFPPAELRQLFIDHPLMRQLARRLVWRDATSGATFRIDESGGLTDASDKPLTLRDDARVSVAHPLELSDETKAAWGRLLSDYELLQPFPQLSRETFSLADLPRAIGKELAAPKLVFGLERAGWIRYGAEDGGSFNGHYRPLGHDLEAHVEYDGAVGMGYIEDKEILTVREVAFGKGRDTVEPSAVDPIALSETLRDVILL